MAINPYVPATAVGNGTQVDFTFTFPYIFPAHVTATINGVATTAFTFFSSNILRFNTPPANGATVRIFRETPANTLAAVIQPGGPLPIVGLNNNFLQSLYYNQETQYDAANQSTAGLQAQIDGITVTSNTALATAGSAVTTANAATATANGIAGTANTALATAGSAVTTANTALNNSVAAAPPGTIQFFAGVTPPSGWLKANGALVSRTTYAALFAAISTSFGAGDGSTTFPLPDLRGEFLRGWDDGRGVDSGRARASAQSATGIYGEASTDLGFGNSLYDISTTVGINGDSTISTSGSGATQMIPDSTGAIGAWYRSGITVRPRNIALLAIIKF